MWTLNSVSSTLISTSDAYFRSEKFQLCHWDGDRNRWAHSHGRTIYADEYGLFCLRAGKAGGDHGGLVECCRMYGRSVEGRQSELSEITDLDSNMLVLVGHRLLRWGRDRPQQRKKTISCEGHA